MEKKTTFEMVGEFHEKFGLPVAGDGPPRMIDHEAFLFRLQFNMEEAVVELLQAYRNGDLAGVADALADAEYVICGMAHFFRIPLDDVMAEVQRANMSKVRSSGDGDPRSKRGSSLDVVKPEGWTPPDVAGILARFGG